MQNKDWIETGEEILRSVLTAVENQDYTNLSKNIENKVNETIAHVGDKITINYGNKKYNATEAWVKAKQEKEKAEQERLAKERAQQNAATQNYARRQSSSQRYTSSGTALTATQLANNPQLQYPQLYKQKLPGTYSGPVCKVLGVIGTSVFGLATLVLTITGFNSGTFDVWLADFIVATGLGGSIATLVHGIKTSDYVNRFKTYVKQIGNKQYCELEKLAMQVGKKKAFVEKEIRSMMNKGFFLQGHLDNTGQTLIASDFMYQKYLDAEQSRKTRELETAKQIAQKALNSEYSEQVQQILAEGEKYIQHIHEANDAIPGEVMSQKLATLEDIMKRIFEQLKRDPSSADDLQKLMKYYLPTTTKLIDAYQDMDGQPSYGGNNIANTKKEIENTLDIINDAFGKLFDDMFEDAAWDISTEISTMKTMLAKEGLTGGDDFVIKELK